MPVCTKAELYIHSICERILSAKLFSFGTPLFDKYYQGLRCDKFQQATSKLLAMYLVVVQTVTTRAIWTVRNPHIFLENDKPLISVGNISSSCFNSVRMWHHPPTVDRIFLRCAQGNFYFEHWRSNFSAPVVLEFWWDDVPMGGIPSTLLAKRKSRVLPLFRNT